MGSCCSNLCADLSICYARAKDLWEMIKPKNKCDYVVFPFFSLFVGGIFVVTIVIAFLGFSILGCTGFGRCWGKGFLKKLRNGTTVSNTGDETTVSPNLQVCENNEYVMVGRQK